uniref:Uncharacterized protein n=1 Tax=Spongospora subterranea TaxID=70186 RepID=A0A0H5QGI2_9EUKA|eukprot:CRZ00707.1 hypothetical protein [Spongospora subterranea]
MNFSEMFRVRFQGYRPESLSRDTKTRMESVLTKRLAAAERAKKLKKLQELEAQAESEKDTLNQGTAHPCRISLCVPRFEGNVELIPSWSRNVPPRQRSRQCCWNHFRRHSDRIISH